MKSVFFILSVLLIAACGGSKEKVDETSTEAVAVTAVPLENQSASDQKLTKLIDEYFGLKSALTEADSMAINAAAVKLLAVVDTVNADSVDTDPVINNPVLKLQSNIIAETKGLLGETDITEKRKAFSMISDNLKSLIETVQYKGQTLYQQTCPMAFNDNDAASWLSNSTEVVNPYLGKNHPKYKSGMLHCGEVTDTLSFK
jgi:hypothetical protein